MHGGRQRARGIRKASAPYGSTRIRGRIQLDVSQGSIGGAQGGAGSVILPLFYYLDSCSLLEEGAQAG